MCWGKRLEEEEEERAWCSERAGCGLAGGAWCRAVNILFKTLERCFLRGLCRAERWLGPGPARVVLVLVSYRRWHLEHQDKSQFLGPTGSRLGGDVAGTGGTSLDGLQEMVVLTVGGLGPLPLTTRLDCQVGSGHGWCLFLQEGL